MSLTTAGLPDLDNQGQGVTAHYAFSYDTYFLVPPLTNQPVADLMANAEQDFNLLQSWFEGVSFPFNGSQIPVQVLPPGPGGGASWNSGDDPPTVSIVPLQYYSAESLRYLLVSEVAEMFMMGQNLGWFEPNDGDEGSMGEGLSRFLGEQFLIANGFGSVPSTPSIIVPNWLNGQRADYVDKDVDDNQPDQTTGCSLCFIWYLHSQLDHHIQTIIKSASFTNLATVYQNLGNGPANTAWNNFINLINVHYPPFAPNGTRYIYHPISDNIFPVAHLHTVDYSAKMVRGETKPATIKLDRAAMAEVRVFLTSSDDNCISVPNHVTFTAGDIAFTIDLTAAVEKLPYSSKTVKITATYAGHSVHCDITVEPPTLTHFTADHSHVICGNQALATVTLSAASDDGAAPITLSSTHPEIVTFTPAPFSIPQSDTKASFTINVKNVMVPFSPIDVGITATLGSSSRTLHFHVIPPTVAVLTLTPNPVECGTALQCLLALDQASQLGDVIVDMAWAPTGFVGGPFQVTIPATIDAKNFSVNIPLDVPPFASTGGSLSATYLGTTITTDLALSPSPTNGVLKSLTLPATIAAGQPVTATITLVQAYLFDVTVGLEASSFIRGLAGHPPLAGGQVGVPSQVIVPANNETYDFTFPTYNTPDFMAYTLAVVASAFGTFATDMTIT
jgi:hypothetical protein